MIIALGVAWVLDGIEITIASSVVGELTSPLTLGLSTTAAGGLATVYLLGEVVGALFFGAMSDKLGRRNLFMITLSVYMIGSGLTFFTWGSGPGWVVFLYLTRFIAGLGIGGEYAAINAAIDEMMPARYRGRVDIGINGTYWLGAIIGTLVATGMLNLFISYPDWGWRVAFLVGPILGIAIILMRRGLPESPRWLMMHGREAEAEEAITDIENRVRASGREIRPVGEEEAIVLKPGTNYGYWALTRVLFKTYPQRAVLSASLMITQSFLYNAIFFTYVLVLTNFYGISVTTAPLFLIFFAIGNLAGPLLLGRYFDTIGRKFMISGTYILSGVLLVISAWLFEIGAFNATTQTIAWCVIFFFASAGASSAYLTVSEIFPIEVRAKAIAVFFSIGMGVGAFGPLFYGWLIGDGLDRTPMFIGYLIGAGIMMIGGVIEILFGINAEGQSLEDVATPLSAAVETEMNA
ncbi:MAG: MFS transporter [Actinobacteria bacterium]|nr:MFS transporter [Actinomycetota bacterium]